MLKYLNIQNFAQPKLLKENIHFTAVYNNSLINLNTETNINNKRLYTIQEVCHTTYCYESRPLYTLGDFTEFDFVKVTPKNTKPQEYFIDFLVLEDGLFNINSWFDNTENGQDNKLHKGFVCVDWGYGQEGLKIEHIKLDLTINKHKESYNQFLEYLIKNTSI